MSTNVLGDQLNLGAWLGSTQVTSALDSESDAEEGGGRWTLGLQDEKTKSIRPGACETQVASVTLSLNLTLNVTHHGTNTVQMVRDLE